MKKFRISTVLLLLSSISFWNSGFAQDIHFSQIFDSQLMQNPANAGSFKGDQRASLHYRNQWSSVASPFRTYALNLDGALLKKKSETGYLGLGAVVFKDAAGDTDLGTTKAELLLSYHLKINESSTITGGIQSGFTQVSIDPTNGQWDNQYDGRGYNPTLATGETRSFDPFTQYDVGAGVLWTFSKDQETKTLGRGTIINFGAAVYHINRPKQSFYELVEEKQYSKITVHGDASLGKKNTKLDFLPSFLYQRQGNVQELVVGTQISYEVKEGSKYTGLVQNSAILGGIHYRVQDALITSVTFKYSNYSVGISYDFNVSSLNQVSRTRGGTEITLKFTNPNPFKKKVTSSSTRFL